MPQFDAVAPQTAQIPPDFLKLGTNTGLEREIGFLRQEIAQLRQLLSPVNSIIMTGPQAMEVYRRILRG